MIAGVRKLDAPHFRGFNVFVLRDWIAPPDSLGLQCFGAFDEYLLRSRTDPDATRVEVPGAQGMSELTAFNTATLSGMRSLPERYRPLSALYTVALVSKSAEERFLWTNAPDWVKLSVETKDGNLDSITTSARDTKWRKIPLQEGDLFLHLHLLQPAPSLRLKSWATPQFFRLSRLIEATPHARAESSFVLRVASAAEDANV